MAVVVRIPGLLADVGDGRTAITVEATTVAEALEAVFAEIPQLRVHVFDETGAVRRHVTLFHEGRRVTDPPASVAVADGDVVRVLQAVSGGARGSRSAVRGPRPTDNVSR